MARFVSRLGVTVLSCHQVEPRRSQWQRLQGIKIKDRKAFRLCVPREESDRMLNADAWPAHIAITAWRFGKKKTAEAAGGATTDDEQSDERFQQPSLGTATPSTYAAPPIVLQLALSGQQPTMVSW